MTEPFKLISSVYLLLRRDDELLLLRRANTGYQDGRCSLVAGHLNGDERATDAIAREAREEAGIEVQASSLRFVHTCHRLTMGTPGQERLDLFFEARSWRGEVRNMEPAKCDDLTWHPVDRLPERMLP